MELVNLWLCLVYIYMHNTGNELPSTNINYENVWHIESKGNAWWIIKEVMLKEMRSMMIKCFDFPSAGCALSAEH